MPYLEIWLADGPRFSTNNANLYTAGGLSTGANSIAFPLSQNMTTTTPNGFATPGGMWSPTADDWWLQVNSISFGAPAGASVDYTIDKIRVSTVPESRSLVLFCLAAPGTICCPKAAAKLELSPSTFASAKVESY